MTTALLECPVANLDDHAVPCVVSLACWWREVSELELRIGYAQSSLPARDIWDTLIASEIPAPRDALYSELRECCELSQRLLSNGMTTYPSLLDRFVWVSLVEGLPLPKYAPLAAFRLRQRLFGMKSAF